MNDGGIVVGYGGFGYIDWKTDSLVNTNQGSIDSPSVSVTDANTVFLTGASVNITANRPVQQTYRSHRTNTNVSSILVGVGTVNISGNITFDMSRQNLSYFLNSNRIKRNTYFHFGMSDGKSQYIVYHCVWNSISFSASVGSLVSCNISYTALNKRQTTIGTPSRKPSSAYFDHSLVAYWDTAVGNCIQSFNVTFTQNVTPVYLNNSFLTPTYLRCGNIAATADIESWQSWQDVNEVKIGSKTITFNKSMYNMIQYSHAGAADIGKHKFQISTVAVNSPTDTIFSIS